jgi:hypothetical protein
MKRVQILTVSVLIIAMLFMTVSISNAKDKAHPTVLPPNARVKGLTLGDWGAKEWQALFAIPAEQNPLLGHLWPTCYLERIKNVGVGVAYGPSGSSECEMPTGMMLYVPVLGSECSSIEEPTIGGSEEELRACVLNLVPDNLNATIDGIDVQNIEDYTALTPLFQFDLPEDNILGAPAGTYDSIGYSTGFLLAPLSRGEHTIHVHGEIPNGSFAYDWIYHITVTNKGGH